MNCSSLLQGLIPAIHTAGEAALAIYRTPFHVGRKQDGSQVTAADTHAETLILAALTQIAPSIPVIAEESYAQSVERKNEKRFFLVDPIDGTSDFVNRTDQFTVNIALVENNKPVFGMILAPVFGKLWFTGADGRAAYRLDNVTSGDPADLERAISIKAKKCTHTNRTALISNSGASPRTLKLLTDYNATQTLRVGSSLKFCYLAEGRGDFYPRLGRTMIWDTAAGQAILEAAGGRVVELKEGRDAGEPLRYDISHTSFENPSFIAWAS